MLQIFYRNEQYEPPSLDPSLLILTAKAKILYERFYGSSDSSESSEDLCFKASRDGLLSLKQDMVSANLSANSDEIEPFGVSLADIIEE